VRFVDRANGGFLTASVVHCGKDQGLTVHLKQLKKAGCKVIRSEKITGTTRNGRKELETILEFIRKGDQLVVTKLDRLARDLLDLQLICRTLEERAGDLPSNLRMSSSSMAWGSRSLP
jgi:hypothetical protein